jgi:hypothetical protein
MTSNWTPASDSGGGLSRSSSATGSASGRDGASAAASAASCSSSLLGAEAALELLPCAALVFNTQGQLMGVNSKAADVHTTGAQGRRARAWRGTPAPKPCMRARAGSALDRAAGPGAAPAL